MKVNRHRKTCSVSLSSEKVHRKTSMCCYRPTSIRMAIKKPTENWKITSISEDLEKLELFCNAGRIIKQCKCYGKQYRGSSNN